MQSWSVIILFGFLVITVISRPQQADYNNDRDIEENDEEDENDAAPDSYSADDDETRLYEQETAVQEEDAPRSRHLLDLTESRYMQRNPSEDHTARANIPSETLSDTKVNRYQALHDESPNERYNEQSKPYAKRRQSNKYNDANDEPPEIHLTNREVAKSNRVHNQDDNQINKRIAEVETTANEEGEMLFENNREQVNRVNKNEYNANDASDSEQPRYFNKYYNTMQTDNRDMIDDKSHDGARYNFRDRRDTADESEPENSNIANDQGSKESNDKTDSEDEEAAIKRHIKKLSSSELNQLLNSLTEEKRELLKKIIDDTASNDNGYINKREITKKAGAVEENNYIENCQSDLSKVQGGSPSLDVNTASPSSSNTDTTEGSAKQQESQSDNSEPTPKSSDSSLSTSIDEIQKKSDNSLNTFSLNIDPKSQPDIAANVQVTSKTEIKREANLEDLEDADESLDDIKMPGQDYLNDQGYFGSQDDNLSDLLDEESQLREDKAYKREVNYDKQAELSESIKSLEESFPNSNAYHDSGPYSGPLVRVKRKNCDQIVKKRSASLVPDSKVAYFPYKAENDDEDNDEGNEFDDEGFYDRTSNFANSNKGLDEDAADKLENSIQTKNLNDQSKSSKDIFDSDTMSLGSDTDSVLSGVEGVDDNLMYSSGVRNRRTAADNSSGMVQPKFDRSTSLAEEESKLGASENYNAVHYQENDAFGPLPRNYDGDLARYKRIRRVKQLHNAQDLNYSDI